MQKLVRLMLMCCMVLLFLLLIHKHVSDPIHNGSLGIEPFHGNCLFLFLFGHEERVRPGPTLIIFIHRDGIMGATVCAYSLLGGRLLLWFR